MKTSITVKGMACDNCRMSVIKALKALPGVSDVKVDLLSGKTSFEADPPLAEGVVKKALDALGFEVVG